MRSHPRLRGRVDFEQFEDENRTVDAVVRNLEVIAEAAKTLPEDVKSQATEVEWRKIASLRNILAHEYFAINMAILWDIVQNKVGPLDTACRELLATLADGKKG